MRSFGQNPNPDFESKNGLFVPLGKSRKGFRIHCTHSEEGIDRFNPNPDFLDLKSKRSNGNGCEKKSTHGQRGLANIIVPSLLSFVHTCMTARVFVVINPFWDLAFH